MKTTLLLTPGPTQLPAEVCAALGKPIIHHRTPEFQENLIEAVAGLQYIFQTKNDVYIMASSGTGAMEAAVCNIVSPGDKVIIVEGGKFGERWTELCEAYGAQTEVIKVPWGSAVEPQQIKTLLDKDKDIKAVFTTLTETSTGVLTDVKAIAKIVQKTSAVQVVDAISGLGVVDLQMDAWGVDVVLSGSQKGFMLPPGLSFISANDKAFVIIEACTSPRYYFDLRKAKKAWGKQDTAFTPAIGIIIALNESVRLFKDTGLENLFNRFARLSRATQAAAKALGLGLLPNEHCMSNALTAITLPDGLNGDKLVKTMRDTHGISIAGGQAQLKGKLIRIAHMGCVDESDILTGISCLEKVLKDLGHSFSLGAGLQAAQQILNTD